MAPAADAVSFYEDEKNLKKLCDFLRSSEGPPVREAIEMDKRVYYLKGKFPLSSEININVADHHASFFHISL